MKKIGLVALFALLLAGCDDGGEKKAQENLRKAEAALEKRTLMSQIADRQYPHPLSESV